MGKHLYAELRYSGRAFLKAALDYYNSVGVSVSRAMTDHGSCYKAFTVQGARRALGLKHIRTRPYTSKTSGKAERFIQIALREWAYACAYPNSEQRAQQLPDWMLRYNWHRSLCSLNANTPISRLRLPEDILLMLHS